MFQFDIIHIILISFYPGYHAVGAKVTLATLAIVDLSALDLSYKTQRINNILHMIKLAALL